jgi:hypothetical protein
VQVNEVPEPWASAMIAKDFMHGQRPSIRALARAAGIGSAETVRQMIYAARVPDPDTVDRVASALGKSPVEVSRWVSQERTTRKPYKMPQEIALLTDDEQAAVTGLIKAIAKGRRPAKPIARRAQLRAVSSEDHQEDLRAAAYRPEVEGKPFPPGPVDDS